MEEQMLAAKCKVYFSVILFMVMFEAARMQPCRVGYKQMTSVFSNKMIKKWEKRSLRTNMNNLAPNI